MYSYLNTISDSVGPEGGVPPGIRRHPLIKALVDQINLLWDANTRKPALKGCPSTKWQPKTFKRLQIEHHQTMSLVPK